MTAADATHTSVSWKQAVLPFATVPYRDIDSVEFYSQYFSQHRAVLVTSCFDGTTSSPLCALSSWTAESLLSHPEVAALPVEVTTQALGDVMNAKEFSPGANFCASDALSLLTKRREHPSDAQALYVKVPLTDVPSLIGTVPSFLSSASLEPVSHPLLLRPGGYFCWAFVGEAGSGSKTHTDVMSSDAWLVVVRGKKSWALCHPSDRHLVIDAQGAYANLLDIDYERFPHARRARITRFTQCTGDAIYVPADAPHTVVNDCDSMSITFNFILDASERPWSRMLKKMMNEDDMDGQLDLVLCEDVSSLYSLSSTSSSHHRTDHRGVDPAVAAEAHDKMEEEENVRTITISLFLPSNTFRKWDCKLLSDFGARVHLDCIHDAVSSLYGARFVRENLRTVGLGKGHDAASVLEKRAVVYLDVPFDSFEQLLSRVSRVEHEDCPMLLSNHFHVVLDTERKFLRPRWTLRPSFLLPTFSSHIGSLPDFPPLSVLLQQAWFFETSWTLKPLAGVLQMRRKATSHVADPGPDPFDVGRLSLWHYSRFHWRAPSGQWPPVNLLSSQPRWQCATFLFYSSPFLLGPLSLFPLLEDATLQKEDGLQGARQCDHPPPPPSYAPHFEEFTWNVGALLNPLDREDVMLGCIELGEDLQRELLTKMLLTAGGPSFISFCSQHRGLHDVYHVDWSACGVEKLTILALYFGTRPGVVGFTYSYKFRCISEPSTLCLMGSSAHHLLARKDPSAIAMLATNVCSLIESGQGSENDVVEKVTTWIRDVAKASADVSEDLLRSWVRYLVTAKAEDIRSLKEGMLSDESGERRSHELKLTVANDILAALR